MVRLLVSSGLLLLVGAASAQDRPAVSAPEVRFRTPPVSLPHPEVQALAQGADGLLWIGTRDGLSRYDGIGLTTLRPAAGDSTSLPSSDVQAVLTRADGTVWVGTSRGLASLDVRTDRVRRWTRPERGVCSGAVAWLAEDGAGRLVFGGPEAGLCRLDPGTGALEAVDGPWGKAGRVRALHGQPDGAVWAVGSGPGAAAALCLIAARGGDCRAVGRGAFAPWMLGGAGPVLAVGEADGGLDLRQWSGDGWDRLVAGLPAFGVGTSPHLLGVGREAWATTATHGVLAIDLDARTWRWLAPTPGDPTSLPAHRVGALLVDRQGGVWVGTSRGLARWQPPVRPFTVYRRYTGREGEISDDRVNGVAETRDGSLWVTTNDGLNRFDPEAGRFETFRVSPGQGMAPPAWAPRPDDPYRDAWWQVLEGSDATLWVGGKRNGVFRLDRRTGLFRREVEAARALRLVGADGVPQGFGVRHLYEDRSGHLWVGTTGEGLAVRHPDGDWEAMPAGTAGLPHPNVNRFYEDGEGRLWVGTDAGLARLRHGTEAGDRGLDDAAFEPVDLGLGEGVPVWSIGESPATPGDVWVGTVGGGLVRLDPQSGATTPYTTAEGMPSDLVFGVLSDDDGRVWASTSRGLARLVPETGRILVYDEDQGLPGDAFDLMAFYRSPTTGEMWFGGPSGLVRVDPAGAAVSTYRPPVAFTGVQVFDAVRPGRPLSGDTLGFAHDENFLTVQFAALDFTAPRDLVYQYRLVGVDEGWRVTTGDRPVASYTALEPGTYRFEVLGSNVDGVVNDEPAVLTLVVRAAWWQRPWVLALGWALLGVAVVAGGGAVARRAADAYRDREQRIADDLHAGPVRGIDRVGAGLDRLGAADAAAVASLREHVGEVETGLHDALLRLQPSAVGRLGLRRALTATVRRFRRAAPHVVITADWRADGDGLAPEAQQALLEAATALIGHVLRVTDARTVDVALTRGAGEVVLRVAHDGAVPLTTPALRDRLRNRRSGLARAASVARAHGGALRSEGAAVEVAVPEAAATAA